MHNFRLKLYHFLIYIVYIILAGFTSTRSRFEPITFSPLLPYYFKVMIFFYRFSYLTRMAKIIYQLDDIQMLTDIAHKISDFEMEEGMAKVINL